MSKQENRKDGTAREESFGALEQAMPQSGGDMGDTMAFTPLGKQAEKQQPAQAAEVYSFHNPYYIIILRIFQARRKVFAGNF